MTYATPLSPAAAGYLEALAEQLSDFPADEREEILGDVEASLLEAGDASPETLHGQFGSPGAFAAELRVAAGLGRQVASPPRGPRLLERARAALNSPRTRQARAVGSRLAPVWWLVRAYVVVAGLALLLGAHWSVRHPFVPRIGDETWTALAFGAALAASIAAGLSPLARRAFLVLDVAAAVALVPVAVDLVRNPVPYRYVYVELPAAVAAPTGLNVSGEPVTNIYPFTRSGRLLHDVLLYDQQGKPLTVGSAQVADPERRLLRTLRGVALYNSFPVRYFEQGTALVAHPNAGPAVHVPRTSTP